MRYLVIGAAGHAQEVAWSLAEESAGRGEHAELLFFDDALPRGPVASGLGQVVGGLDDVARYAREHETRLAMGIGMPRTKLAVAKRLAAIPLSWATVIHPRAIVGPNVLLGAGSYVGAGAILTVNVRIGRFATINMHCQVAHDDVLGDFVTLHPDAHLSGNVSLGDGCELGCGSVVIPGTSVGAWAVLGAGAVAVRPLAGGEVYAGIPARPLSDRTRRLPLRPARDARAGRHRRGGV